MSITEKILCSKTHEYIMEADDGNYYVGLTDYAVEQLGDIVFVELPEVGTSFNKGDVFGTVESVKAASEIYMPINGTVVEINEAVIESPELLNEDSYEKAWLMKIDANPDAIELDDLLSYADYKEEVQ